MSQDLEESLELVFVNSMNDETIDNALDRDDLLSLVSLFITISCGNLVIFERLKEDVAIADEKLFA